MPGATKWLIAAMLPVLTTLAGTAPVAAQDARERADVERILAGISDQDRVQKALSAVAAQHLVRGQWNFSLFSRTELRWWQQALAPAVPPLVQMLADERGLEWVDGSGVTEKVTTPRKEATLALLALERASVGPLIAVLDQPTFGRKADDLLRRIVGGGPPAAGQVGQDRGDLKALQASWQQWWQQNQARPLPREHGQFGTAVLVLLLVLGAVALVFWLQHKRSQRPPRRHPLSARYAAPEGEKSRAVAGDQASGPAAPPTIGER
jgi:hypothetical protein